MATATFKLSIIYLISYHLVTHLLFNGSQIISNGALDFASETGVSIKRVIPSKLLRRYNSQFWRKLTEKSILHNFIYRRLCKFPKRRTHCLFFSNIYSTWSHVHQYCPGMSRTASLTWEWRGVNVGFELENKLKSDIIILIANLRSLSNKVDDLQYVA